jgi:chromosome condensin MukBEF ATPase and DNA-binding subunit MukB
MQRTVETLPPRQRETYLKVQAYKKENPDASWSEAHRKTKTNVETYRLAERNLGLRPAKKKRGASNKTLGMKRKPKPKVKQAMQTIVLEESSPAPRAKVNFVIMSGNVEDVLPALNQFLANS